MSLIEELKRRNVIRVGAAYIVTAWLVIQVVETVFPIYEVSNAAMRIVISALAVGLVPVLFLAWALEITPEGLKWEKDVDRSKSLTSATGKTLDRIIIVVLAIAVSFFEFDKFVLCESREAAIAESAREEGRSEAILGSFGDRSIAVLAFDDMSPGKDQEYMSDGIAEEILNLLAKIRDLRVISRSSAFSFKGEDINIPDVAAQLNAAYILEGSVRTAGDQVRITAQLIEGSTDSHVWSNTYDRKLENIFEIQDEIAAAVVEELKVTLLDEAPKSQPIDPEAYKLILQARYLWYRRAEGDEQKVLEMYQQAVEMVPDYAPAWAGLSVAWAVHYQKGRMDREEGLRLARETAEKALELDPDSADALVRMGQALARARDADGMRDAYNRAYELEPDNPLVLGVISRQLRGLAQFDKAIEYLERAAEIDPLGAIWSGNKADILATVGRYDEAEAAYARALELNGNLQSYNMGMADIYIYRREYDKAVEALREVPVVREWQLRHAVAEYGVGNIEKSNRIIEQMKGDDHPAVPSAVAAAHAERGEIDLAFEWLARDEFLARRHVEFQPYYRNLRDDPSWLPYLESLDERE
jgi:TolB-like protein/Flp pilus assembly protein TadD